MSLALARKYRPKNFTQLIGQEGVAQTLTLALQSKRLSHAYLFSGIRGSGKTSTARIFAKALLCSNGPTPHPCEECENCKMANENRHIDIIEMDAASNRGIDDIKELIEHTKYKPSIGRFKIFIIDEVHMLTTQAFNALLKTLEEPPEFVKFILATTDPLKIPATILSRVQHFRFKKIPQHIVRAHLEHILNLENIEYEKEALEIIARSGSGSLRDSLTLLDQAIVYSKGIVDLHTVTQMLGIIDPKILEELFKAILKGDEEHILEFLKKSQEFEAEMIIDEMIIFLKEALLFKKQDISKVIIDRFFRILSQSKSLLALGSDGEFVLTLTLFKMKEALSIYEIDEMIEKLQSELGASIKQEQKSIKEEKKDNISLLNTNLPPKTEKSIEDSSKLKFKKLIEKIYDRNYELGELFEKRIKFIDFKDNILIWESSATNEEKETLKQYWQIIRLFVQEIFGIDTKIKNINKINPQNSQSQNKEENSNFKTDQLKEKAQ
ncbi:MAG: DNA polymerase III subunit gamma/tau, partial [Epsilonproteobacteria bacterium]|nr:DNA polymerase III subunit gamma/tau [Campylobacterota bacterium]